MKLNIHLVPFHFDADMARNSVKKMVEAGEFSRKMETHLLLKRGIWFFLIPG